MATNPKFNTLEGLYRSFSTILDVASGEISSSSKIKDADLFRNIFNILFPSPAGSFYSCEDMWKEISSLAQKKNESDNDAAKRLAKVLRVYYYSGSESVSPVEQQIKNFYEKDGKRPSAYNHLPRINTPTPAVQKPSSPTPSQVNFRSMLDDDSQRLVKSKLMMILVDSPAVDITLRNADKVDVFTNYMPTMMMSQAVPYLDVSFVLSRSTDVMTSNGQTNKSERNLNSMGQLKFLMGAEQIQDGSANALIYDSNVLLQIKNSEVYESTSDIIATKLKERAAAQNITGQTQASQNSEQLASQFELKKSDKQKQTVSTSMTAGMETFTMPQTLINMDYDQTNNPRFNAVIDPTRPFGTITGFKIEVRNNVGFTSYKTAQLTLKIFDRSRLSEMADFLNPKLYSTATVWVTYGWRTNENSENEYSNFINENMLKREAYGIYNSAISMDNSGVCTVTLSLTTKGANEFIEVTPDPHSAVLEGYQRRYEDMLAKIQEYAQQLGLGNYTNGAKDIRGSQVIGAALQGKVPELDPVTLNNELIFLQKVLASSSNPITKDFLKLINNVYSKTGKGAEVKSKSESDILRISKTLASNRFKLLKNPAIPDLFAVVDGKFASDDGFPAQALHPLQVMYKKINDPERLRFKSPDATSDSDKTYGSFGNISFGRLFFSYFATATASMNPAENPIIDEYQLICYNLNKDAGLVACTNIAEFPMDMSLLEAAYSKAVAERKGEHMSLINFLEIVRSSQFGEIRHKAYGFSDLYEKNKDGTYKIRQDREGDYLNRQVKNEGGSGGSFVQPVIDFYIETGYEAGSSKGRDLLLSYERAAVSSSTKARPKGLTRIMRIHIFDKAATTHKTAAQLMTNDSGNFVELKSEWQDDYYKFIRNQELERLKRDLPKKSRDGAVEEQRNSELVNTLTEKQKQKSSFSDSVSAFNNGMPDSIKGSGLQVREILMKDVNGKPSFELLKRKIAENVPTILIGSEASTIKNVTYSSNQDSQLNTVMIMRSFKGDDNPTTADGSSGGNLPLQVIPGSLSMTMLGCPLVEYMQQFFVDLGTGTSIDALYNVTGLTHQMSPGIFTTDIKFTYSDGYGAYRSSQPFMAKIVETLKKIESNAKSVALGEATEIQKYRK